MTTTHKILLGGAVAMLLGAVCITVGLTLIGATAMSLGFLALLVGPVVADF